ncbi:Crp/Fnr family transcriptional regulator [Marinilongibacter aquaticus]|uniref:Crp/Fnr family transcriptional regulator n=1 Tax=Marinilongibacter aquaticus TaxID=2975157 RepID=UPI0021BDE254|nr:Crp/Fnr family transcriptional regulator [Marinilongibacter aquaticus]UBM59488.1 Crp/Fnr family transcriptional regulator [Marinilongibacter aquaticus]
MYEALKQTLDKILKITDDDWAIFESILETKKLKKKEYLLREGQICRGIYFLSEGIMRTFHTNNDGKEINTAFYFQNDFLREIESMTHTIPSQKNIQTLKDSTVFYIDKSKLQRLYEKSEFYQKLGRMILEKLTISEQKYSSFLTTYSPKERYLYLVENRPECIEQIPLQYLASYLGISRESLSRIRKRIQS